MTQIPRRGLEGIFSAEDDDDDEDEEEPEELVEADDDVLVKLPGAMTKATRIIQANRLARMLCERGILSMLSAMFIYRV